LVWPFSGNCQKKYERVKIFVNFELARPWPEFAHFWNLKEILKTYDKFFISKIFSYLSFFVKQNKNKILYAFILEQYFSLLNTDE
jgi:hypothetical protein